MQITAHDAISGLVIGAALQLIREMVSVFRDRKKVAALDQAVQKITVLLAKHDFRIRLLEGKDKRIS